MKRGEIDALEKIPEGQRRIIYNCLDAFEDIKYLQGSEAKLEAEKEILDFDVFYHVQGLLWNYLILELWKLFSDNKKNDHYSLRFFLQDVKQDYENVSFKEYITTECIDSYATEFKSKLFKQHHEKLKAIRNQHVAHLDLKRVEVNIKNDDILYFLTLAKRYLADVIDPITTKGGSSLYMRHPTTLENFVKKMAEYKGVYDKIENSVWNAEERN